MNRANSIWFGLLTTLVFAMCSCTVSTPPVVVSEKPQEAPVTPTAQTPAIPMPPTPLPVQMTKEIPYTSERKLDVYVPTSPGTWPIVVVLHGLGDMKEMFAPLSQAIAGRGAVVFTPNWRFTEVASADQIAGQAEDVACAVRFARLHASEYHGNSSKLVVVGHSGGAVIGAVVSLAGDDFHGDCLVEEGSALPDGFVGLDGGYDNIRGIDDASLRELTPERWAVISPFEYVFIDRRPARQNIQFDIMVGTVSVLLMRHGYAFYYGLLCDGYNATLTELPGVNHAGMSQPREEILQMVMAAAQR
jgi:pimeloyl-ACP methyl ester carboxylesterase